MRRAVVGALIGSLMAGLVWAGDFSDLKKIHQLVGDDFLPIVTCNDALTQCWTPCELRMKNAMREIDPYVSKTVELREVELVYEPPSVRLRREADSMDRKDAAVNQFRDAVKECAQ